GGTVTSQASSAFASATDLENALQTAINNALAQVVALGGTGGTVTVGLDSGTGKFTLSGTSGIGFRGQVFVNTITGMTAVTGGSGGDTFDVVGSNQIDRDALNTSLNLVTVSAPDPSGLDVSNANQTVTVSSTAHDVGYFTLQYAYDQTSP